MHDSPVLPNSGLREGPQVVGPSSEEPVEMGELRIQEDESTVITFRDSALPFSPGAPTSTATQLPAGEAAIQTQRDVDRLLALQLLNLEWTSLPPEVQQAAVVLLHAATKSR